ncbi:MAG TPA: ABC transporter ATP-binding protein, partial [Acholeplasma sp.]|nr:ABC transporter ATP-binding protein [Acholeplasma sp.]
MIFGKHFGKYYFKYGIAFILGIAALIGVDYIQVQIPGIYGSIIDKLNAFSKGELSFTQALATKEINGMIFTIIWMIGIMVIGRFLWRITVFGASRSIEHDIRNDLFRHAESLGQDYYAKEKVGGIMTYFTNDLDAIRMAFGPGVLMIIDSLFLGTMVIIKMTELSVTLTLLAVVPLFFMGIVMFFILKKMKLKFKLRQDAFERINDFTQESFSGLQVVRAFVKEMKEAYFFKEKNDEFYSKHIDFVKTMIYVNVVITVFINITILVILSFGAYVALSGKLTSGQITAYFTLFATLIWPVMALSQFANIRSQATASQKRLNTFFAARPSIVDQSTVEVSKVSGDIRFDHLSFAYPDEPETNVLEDITLDIKAGETVGILGRTGSGKSTLVDLLLRLYNVKAASLYLDGHDIMDMRVKDVRKNMAYVPQDNFLFSETIENNIGFSESKMAKEKVIEAAKLSDVFENIMDFKDGFNTILGERGVTLSGGQKQRVSIARAIAKDAPILILDDSVSAVDTKTEEAILANLQKIRKGKTTLIIAHRISTIKKMDKIILLEKGRLLDVGTHEA